MISSLLMYQFGRLLHFARNDGSNELIRVPLMLPMPAAFARRVSVEKGFEGETHVYRSLK